MASSSHLVASRSHSLFVLSLSPVSRHCFLPPPPPAQGVTSFNVAIWGIRLRGGNQAEKGADLAPAGHSEASSGVPWGSLADVFGGERVFCRIVSRGNAASKASDFGTLEVLGGASIGHTDPWVVSAAIGEEIAGLR